MGSWCGTCGISNLPINSGDEVVAFLLGFFHYKDSAPWSGYCYNNGMAQPLTLPIYAKYNDYGGIEDVKDSYVLDIIRQQFDLSKTVDVVDWINEEEDVVGFGCMDSAMEALRIGYNAQAGAGSQNDELLPYERLMESMKEVIEGCRAKIKKWNW